MIDNTINDDKTITDGIGTILAGRYHILRRLGQGGMGSVWLAEDRQLDNRKVAIKMLPSIVVTDKRAYQQLKSEALVSLKLVHPNIVTLRAFEENNGAPFLVMDYIEGQTLSDYLAVKGKLSEAETIKLLKPIAAALDYAHGEKVIHRDVKPSNIIIRKDGHPFILDFGIAREIQESMTRVTGRTISGTLLYMSPEQLRGAPPAPAQDVYSFAAMCYECLKGEPPFTRGEIAYQILNEKPIPLVGEKKLILPVMAGLSKIPDRRPNNCVSVLGKNEALRGCKEINERSLKNAFEGHDVFGKIKYYIKKFWVLLSLFAVVALLLSIAHIVSNAISETWRKNAEEKGRKLYAAINKANNERKDIGMKWLWPQDIDEALSYHKDDLAGKKFATAADYFSELFQVFEYFTNNWMPYIEADLSIVKLEEPCSFKSIRQGLKAEDIGWCVVQNLTEREDERTPVLISANFNCNFIPQSWDGITNAEHHIPYNDSCSGCLAKMDYVIIVRKNGDVLSVAKDKLSLRALFGSRPIQFNRNLSYLTPNGVSPLHKSPNDRR